MSALARQSLITSNIIFPKPEGEGSNVRCAKQRIINPCLLIQMSSKIVKANGAQPDEFELSVATEFANLEVYGSFI